MKKKRYAEELGKSIRDREGESIRGVQADELRRAYEKALNCIYGVCNLIDTPGIFMEEIIQETAALLPSALQYPDLACARITVKDQTYETEKFKESSWRLVSDIKLRGVAAGAVEAYYRHEPPAGGLKPFLPEEVKLIDIMASYLGLIIERKNAEEEIMHLATHDALTDLPTLLLARDRLGIAISLARRNKTTVAVMYVDLDGFKVINDNLGHEAGDYILIRTVQRLLACVRESDTVARVGGDEFLVIASDIHDSDNAAKIAERAGFFISQPIIFKRKKRILGSASIGIALYPNDGIEMEDLIRKSEEAMHKMKISGKKEGFRFTDHPV
ncbi:MAG: Cyclic di-GMP phosphodiesterase Gmr [Syntrophus sp. PtaU1.Bin208]|nr:MAG: Cyclic di-GMP phosphodiesterase Gmr [Syntrophus sp. PtaU1.Bin208]